MNIQEYVEQHFGADTAKKLKSIRTGGDNNKKGSVFEEFFAVAKICSIAASKKDLEDYVISSQECAFVDDLCIIYSK